MFGEVMTFHPVEAPFECPELPMKALSKFLKPGEEKFGSWFEFRDWKKDTKSP